MRPGRMTMHAALSLSILLASAGAAAAEAGPCAGGSGVEAWLATPRSAASPGRLTLLDAAAFAAPRCPCAWAREEALGSESCRCPEELAALRKLLAARRREKVVAEAETGGPGFARVCAAPGRYVARVSGAGLRERLLPLEIAKGGMRVAELVAGAPEPVSLGVRDPAGARVDGARVLAFQAEPLLVADLGKPGADGRFVLPAPFEARHTCFWVEAKGFAPLRACESLERSGGMLRLERTARVRAVIQGPKGPVAGAEVLALGRVVRRAVADGRGVATLTEVPEGRATLAVQQGALVGVAVVEVSAGSEAEVAIGLEEKARAAGVVRDEAGKPVSGAAVACWNWLRREKTKTNARGEFECRPLPGRVQASATRDGYLTATEWSAEAGMSLVLIRAARLTGRVVDEAGRPVSRAAVSVRRPREGPSLISFVPSPDGVAITDSSGRFTVEGLHPGTPTVEVWHPRFAQASLEVTLPGEPRQVVLRTVPLVEVAVRTADGPVRQGCVYMNENDGCLLADVDGVFRGPLPEGAERTSLVAHVAGWVANEPLEVATAPGGQVTRAEIVLGQRTLAIRGRAVWKDGRPGKLVSLQAVPVDGKEALGERASADPDGLFSIEGLPPGRYVLRPFAEEAAGEVEAEAGARDVVLELRRAHCRWPHLRCLIEEKKQAGH